MEVAVNGPSSVGDVIGYSLRICRNEFKMLVRILFLPTIVELIGNLLVIVGINGVVGGDFKHIMQSLLLILPGFVLRLGAEFFLTLRQLALIRLFTGFATTYTEAYDFIWKRKFYVVSTAAGAYMVMMAAAIFWCVIMGVSLVFFKIKAAVMLAALAFFGSMVAMLVTIIVCMLPLCTVTPAIACESMDFSTILSHGIKLAFSNLFRTALFGGLLLVTVYIIAVALDAVPIVLTLVEYVRSIMMSSTHAMPKTINLYVQVLSSIWRSVSNMLVSPMIFVACGLYYVDLRTRLDGLDLSNTLGKLSGIKSGVNLEHRADISETSPGLD